MDNSHCNVLKCKSKFEGFSFKCRKCGDKFCDAHRMPEDHKCMILEANENLEKFGQEELDHENYGSLYEIMTSIFNVNLNEFISKYINGEDTGFKLLGALHDFKEVNLNDYYYLAGALDKFRNNILTSYGGGIYKKSEIETLLMPIYNLKVRLDGKEYDYQNAVVINNELLPKLRIIINELELIGINLDNEIGGDKKSRKSFSLKIKILNGGNNEPLVDQNVKVHRIGSSEVSKHLKEESATSNEDGISNFKLKEDKYEIFINGKYKAEIILNKNTKLEFLLNDYYVKSNIKRFYNYIKGKIFGQK